MNAVKHAINLINEHINMTTLISILTKMTTLDLLHSFIKLINLHSVYLQLN